MTTHKLPSRLGLLLCLAVGTALALAWTARPAGLAHAFPGSLTPAAMGYALLGAAGLLAGLLSGLLGIGGSTIIVPAMVLVLPLLGVDPLRVPHVAIGSSLLAMIPTATLAALAQHRKGALDLGWLRRLGPGTVVGALAGALLALQLRGTLLVLLYAAQAGCYGVSLLRPRTAAAAAGWRGRLADAWGRLSPHTAAPAAAGFCACAGMGAGSMNVPYLLARQVPLLRATATSSALNLALAIAGALAFVAQPLAAGEMPPVCWPAAALVAGAALLSVHAGVALAHRLPVARLRRLLGGVTLVGAGVLVARTLPGLW